MALRHCNVCGCDFPPYSQAECTVCGGQTFFDQGSNLESDWMQKIEHIRAARESGVVMDYTERQKIWDWRMKLLFEAGFTELEYVQPLAESTADIRRAAALLAQGCPERLVKEILT